MLTIGICIKYKIQIELWYIMKQILKKSISKQKKKKCYKNIMKKCKKKKYYKTWQKKKKSLTWRKNSVISTLTLNISMDWFVLYWFIVFVIN